MWMRKESSRHFGNEGATKILKTAIDKSFYLLKDAELRLAEARRHYRLRRDDRATAADARRHPNRSRYPLF